MRGGQLAQGPEVAAFEAEFAALMGGATETPAVSSGTSALHQWLIGLGIGAGAEVHLVSRFPRDGDLPGNLRRHERDGGVQVSCYIVEEPVHSMGYGGLLIPLFSALVAITLLPVLLANVGPQQEWPRSRLDPAVNDGDGPPGRGWLCAARWLRQSPRSCY